MGDFNSYLTLYNLITKTIDIRALDTIINAIADTYGSGRVFICGNGGSFSTAQHFAQDLEKIAGINAESLGNNPAQLTAYANDEGYKEIFVSELDRKARLGDIVIIISCSGDSRNVVEVAKYCNTALHVYGLLGCEGGEVNHYCTESIVIPTIHYDMIESIHSLLCHYITLEVVEKLS